MAPDDSSGASRVRPAAPDGAAHAVDVSAPTAGPWHAAVGHDGPPGPAEHWEFVDPRHYSDPTTAAPVYTSGPPPPPPEPPAYTAPGAGSPPPPPLPPPAPVVTSPMAHDAPSMPATTATVPVGADGAPADPTLDSAYHPQPGELQIKERRAWRTWQLLVAIALALVVGMWINGNAGSPSGVASSSSSHGYKLPPAASPSTTAVAGSASSTTSTVPAGGTTTTTAAGGTTATTAPGAAAAGTTATTAPVVVGPATVLVPATQLTGNWTSPAFTIAGGTWNIGWAFQCVPAPTTTPAFQIFVVTNGGTPSGTPAVSSSDASGNSITPQTTTGSQQIIVQTSPTCRWAAKVTGSSS